MTLESENAATGCAGSPYLVKSPPQNNSSGVFLKRSLPPFNPENVSLRFEPFTDTTLAMESSPDAVGVGGGAWVPQTAPPEPQLRPPSPRTRESQLPKRLLIACRDKESLLEEIITLKTELNCQGRKYQAQKIHSSHIQIENRKLEMDIEELEEMQGAEASRTGGSDKMRTKLHAMKSRLEDLHLICEEQREELMNLRKDLRLTRTRELEIERDVFADEVIRLLKIMKRLKALQNKLTCENKELSVIRDRAVLLEIANKRLENCVLAIQKTLEKTQAETAAFKQRALIGKQEEKRCKELEDQAAKLSGLLDAETAEKEKWLKKAKALENELRKLTKDLRECEAARAACTAGTDGKGGAGAPDAKKVQKVGLSPRTDSPVSKASTKEEVKVVVQPVTPRQKVPPGQGVKAVATPQVSPVKQEVKPVIPRQEVKPIPPATPKQEVKPVTPRQAPSKQGPTKVAEPRTEAATKVPVTKDKAKVPRLSFVQVQQGAGEGMGAPRSSVSEAAMYAAQKEKAEKEAARKAQLEEERRKKAEALEAFKRQQEEELKKKQEEDARRREEARRRKREEEARKKAEEEARLAKVREEEERKKREEEETRRAEEERRKEEEERSRREEEEQSRKAEENSRQEEEERRRKEEDERMQKEEEERRRRAGEDSKRQEEEDAKRKREEEERRRREEEDRRRREQEERKRREEEERKRRDEEERKRKMEEERKERERREAEQRKQKEEEERRRREAEEQARKQREEEERKRTGGRKSAYEDHMKIGDPDAQAKLEKKMRSEGSSGSFVARRLANAKDDGFAEDTKQIVENRGNAFLQHRTQRASVGFALHSTAASPPAGAAVTTFASGAQRTYSRKNLTAPDSVWQ